MDLNRLLLSGFLFLSICSTVPSYAQTPYQQDEATKVVKDVQSELLQTTQKRMLGDQKLREGKRKEAIEAYRASVKLAPKYQKMVYRVRLAVALAQDGQYEEARKELTAFLADTNAWLNSKKSTKGQVLFYLGYTNYYLDRLDDAENFFKLHMEFLEKREPLTLNYLGLIAARKDDLDNAEKYFLEAIKGAGASERPTFQFNLGSLYIRQERWGDAYKFLQQSGGATRFWDGQPKSSRVFLTYQTALAAYNLNKKEISQPLFEKIVDDPDLPESLRYQAAVYLGRVKPEEERAAEVSKWAFLLRSTAQYDTNVQFLPDQGSLATTNDKDSMGYTVLFSPNFAAPLGENLLFNASYYLYYIYHDNRDYKTNDLLNNSVSLWLRRPFERQRVDLGFNIDLPLFNTNGLQVFYQQYEVIPAWYLFWNNWWMTKLYGAFDIVEFREDSATRADHLDGLIYKIGTEQSFFLFDPSWRFQLEYYFSYEDKEGANFEARKHAMYHSVTLPRFGPFQAYYRGGVIFGQYPEFVARPKRKEQRYEFLWNIDTALSASMGLNARIIWLFNQSKKQLNFDYDKVIYEGGFYFLF